MLDKPKQVRRLLLVWIVGIITWVITLITWAIFFVLTAQPNVPEHTATALSSIIGLLTAIVGVLSVFIGLYKWLRFKQEGEQNALDTDS